MSRVRKPLSTSPPDGLRMTPLRGFLRAGKNGPDDQLVRRFRVVRIGSSAKRAVAAILGGQPL